MQHDLVHHHMNVFDVRRQQAIGERYEPVVQETTRGPIEMRYYPGRGTKAAVLCVGGVGGGFDSPVKGTLYPWLCQRLSQDDGISGLRVKFRNPGELQECVMDVLAGIRFLQTEGANALALVGHSFGGAVVIRSAAVAAQVRTCVTLATQGYGAEAITQLGSRCSIMLAHGMDDEILPSDCSRVVHTAAGGRKQLLLKPGVRHGLDEWADELPTLVYDWIRAELKAPQTASPDGDGEQQ